MLSRRHGDTEEEETYGILDSNGNSSGSSTGVSGGGTLVRVEVKPLLDDILYLLERRGLPGRAVFVEKTCTPEERILTNPRPLRGTKVNYLSLLLVKNPHRERGERSRG